ncbi:hypothetical protein BJF83_20270 [Nocardiopsis sp. CNR-923]|uniref:hypothetical protein n=1 Tax=Nocardiopsis sp. CNR-923 TaxID=1904965 RepID=UPI000963DFB0|nr:hypothetical protein [Nocardiopsis sp. CNR-923]OLT26840.1 hypothetical protein BJF83_20270 [Nocardiopsis sp. CNR-923]
MRPTFTEDGSATDLVLAGWRLRVVAAEPAMVEGTLEVMVPPCALAAPDAAADWTVRVREAATSLEDEARELFADRPVLAFPYGGPRLAVVGRDGPALRVVGRYRPDGAAVFVDVDHARRTTDVTVDTGRSRDGRWVDWLVRAFFASRLLAVGWRMLHASAVAVDGVAVLFLAGRQGGKSTLAHRACTELDAAFLADDLVLVGPDLTVVGWPTRVAVPVDLTGAGQGGRVQERVVNGRVRRRVLLSPLEHRGRLGVRYSPPVPLGAVVCVEPADRAAGRSVRPVVAGEVGRDAWGGALARAVDVPAQRLYVGDLLGLTGAPAPLRVQAPVPLRESNVPQGVTAAALRVADMAHLSTVPVWDALTALVPCLGVR